MNRFIISIALIAAAGNAHAWELPQTWPGIVYQEIKQHQWLDKHTHKHDPQYIYDPFAAIADKEFAENVQRINGRKPGEHYVGR